MISAPQSEQLAKTLHPSLSKEKDQSYQSESQDRERESIKVGKNLILAKKRRVKARAWIKRVSLTLKEGFVQTGEVRQAKRDCLKGERKA